MPAGSQTVPVSVVVVPGAQVGIDWHTPVHPHLPGALGSPPHDCGRLQVPHCKVLPHPSPACPHEMFWLAHDIEAQLSGFPPLVPPQTLGMPPPPQVPASQPPHWTTPPHLVSVAAPQLALSCAQVDGTHPVPPPSPKLATPSPLESPGPADESLPPELLVELLVPSTDASSPNEEVPAPWPPPQPEKTEALASKAPATSHTVRFMPILRGASRRTRLPP
jgi:hypothetical protein